MKHEDSSSHPTADRNLRVTNMSIGSFDVVEYGRGQFSALSYATATTAREVHIMRLRSTFERAGIAHKLRYFLNILVLMREAQEMGGGYWFPTPLRVVPIDGLSILVGSVPTRELATQYHGVIRAGYARVADQQDVSDLPVQALDEWLCLDVQDSVAWTQGQLAIARNQLGPTSITGSVQFFNPAYSKTSTTRQFVWSSKPPVAGEDRSRLVLCRRKLAHARFQYFMVSMAGSRIVGEAPAPREVERFQYGLVALAGHPCQINVIDHDRGFIVKTAARLPRPERQLILALGTPDPLQHGLSYRLDSEMFLRIIITRLRRLGCEVTHGHV